MGFVLGWRSGEGVLGWVKWRSTLSERRVCGEGRGRQRWEEGDRTGQGNGVEGEVRVRREWEVWGGWRSNAGLLHGTGCEDLGSHFPARDSARVCWGELCGWRRRGCGVGRAEKRSRRNRVGVEKEDQD